LQAVTLYPAIDQGRFAGAGGGVEAGVAGVLCTGVAGALCAGVDGGGVTGVAVVVSACAARSNSVVGTALAWVPT
jgi:hypothetical protein